MRVVGPALEAAGDVLTPAALAFVADLHDRFALRREHLLAERQRRQDMVSVGEPMDFLPETAAVRTEDWQVAPIPGELAGTWSTVPVIDLSDSISPSWPHLIAAQRRAWTGPVRFRPHGLHLPEKHLTVDGDPAVAALVDVGLYLFHQRDPAGLLSLPLLESHLEARLWADLLEYAATALERPAGAVKVIVSVDTVWAAFEMDELLFELREHAIGLELGLCNYLFSMVKTFRGAGTEYVLPERSRLDASAPFLQACSDLLAATARRRGLAGPADRGPAVDTVISGKDLLDIRSVPLVVTAEGLRDTIATALEILINWLAGTGAMTIADQPVDLATAELCRSQLWQWQRNRVALEGGRRITGHLIVDELDAATERLADRWAERPGGRELLAGARNLLFDAISAVRFTGFISVPAYESMP